MCKVKKNKKGFGIIPRRIWEKLGLTRGAIASVEADGNNFSQILCKLVQIFDINLNYLLTGKGQPFNIPACCDITNEIIYSIKNILLKYEIKKR